MTEIEKIKDKIQKLIALQVSAEKIGSLNEAANAAEKVQILLMKYNLSLDEVGEKQETSNMNHVKFTMEEMGYNPKHSTWVIMLMRGISKLNMCRMITHTGWKGEFTHVTILGTAVNVELTKYLYDQLYNKVRELEAIEWKTYRGGDLRGKFRRGFYMGAALALDNKINDIIWAMKNGNIEGINAEACTALVVKSEVKLQKYVEELFPNLTKGKSLKHNHSDGVALGHARGKEISLNKGLN